MLVGPRVLCNRAALPCQVPAPGVLIVVLHHKQPYCVAIQAPLVLAMAVLELLVSLQPPHLHSLRKVFDHRQGLRHCKSPLINTLGTPTPGRLHFRQTQWWLVLQAISGHLQCPQVLVAYQHCSAATGWLWKPSRHGLTLPYFRDWAFSLPIATLPESPTSPPMEVSFCLNEGLGYWQWGCGAESLHV